MTLDQARKLCEEIIDKYRISHSNCHEERVDGEVKFVHLTLKIKINAKKNIDKKAAI